MTFAAAGRRIDAEGAPPRFPAGNEERVRERIAAVFRQYRADRLVCSAAAGADLLALETASELGIAGRIVLPFPPPVFRAVSVADRGGDWAVRFDRILPLCEVVQLDFLPGDSAYIGANRAILDEARKLSPDAAALVIWNGESRGEGDITEEFKNDAQARGMRVVEVSTL